MISDSLLKVKTHFVRDDPGTEQIGSQNDTYVKAQVHCRVCNDLFCDLVYMQLCVLSLSYLQSIGSLIPLRYVVDAIST